MTDIMPKECKSPFSPLLAHSTVYIMAQFIHTDVSICHHIEPHLYLLLFLALQSTSHIYMRIYILHT